MAPRDVGANPLSEAFGRVPGPRPAMRVLRSSTLLVSEFKSDHRNLVVAGMVPRDDAYIITLHLRDRPKGAMSAEGRWIEPQNFNGGNAGIVDLRLKLQSEYAGPFHYVTYYLKREALDKVADDAGVGRITDLRHRPGVGFSDPVMRHLLMSLRPALAAPGEASALFVDHVAMAFVSHVAQTYGELRWLRTVARGGLTPAQQRRAKELLDAHLDGKVSLIELAGACQLSVRHFTRAFRQSTGQSPHRWLVERRLDKAQGLLELSETSLNEVASACGFATQSHFTRVFTRALGVSPGAWRRARRR